jgi:radical SAM superfamily enzyme YgiQ (UPF0313 family)
MAVDYKEWYDKHFHELTGQGIWLRGGEMNTLESEQFDKRNYRILITRLSTYKDTSVSFTHKLLYQIATANNDLYADFAYLPPELDVDIFARDGVPWFLGTNSKMPGTSFDMIAISNSIIEEIMNMATFLKRSNFPVKKSERIHNNEYPLVILGGANALYTSILHNENTPVDGIFVGEEPELIEQLFSIANEAKKRGATKEAILEELEGVSGFFQPDKVKKTSKFVSTSISEKQLLKNAPIFFAEEQLGTGNLQISEGCPCFCSFCAESWGRKPYREVKPEVLKQAALKMKASMGLETMELYSFNFNMHSNFYTILRDMSHLFANVGLKSQRFDTIAQDPELIKFLHVAGKASITCGLEGISQRLRKYLHKSLVDSTLRNSISILLRAPLRELKIFLIATGFETEEDYTEYKEFLTFINETLALSGRRPRIIFSMTPLVRFPYTPLEDKDAPDPSICREIILQTERLTRCRGFEFRDSTEVSNYFFSQIIVRATDPLVMDSLFSAMEISKFIFYREIPPYVVEQMAKDLKYRSLEVEQVMKGAEKETIENHVCTINVNDSFMGRQSEAVDDFVDRGYCLGDVDKEGTCKACGACESQEMKDSMTALRDERKLSLESLKKVIKDRQNIFNTSFKIEVPYKMRGIPRKSIGIAIARAIMLSYPQLTVPFHKYESSFVNSHYFTDWIHGDDIITLSFLTSSKENFDSIVNQENFIDTINSRLDGWCMVKGLHSDDVKSLQMQIESEYPFDISPYFKLTGLKYTARKGGENQYICDFTKESLKKKVIDYCAYTKSETGATVLITPRPKFVFNEFLSCSFDVPTEAHYSRISAKIVIKD